MITVKHCSTVSTLTWSLMHQLLLLSLYRYLLTDKLEDSAKGLMLVCFGNWVTMRMFFPGKYNFKCEKILLTSTQV